MIEYSDDATRLNIGRIHDWLASSYWSPGIARETVERAVANSHCLGAYNAEGQVGFARMVTDRATFAWLSDVWVDEAMRGQGIGQAMVRWFLNHPDYEGLRRIGLTTADAHGVYAKLGFHPLLRQDRYMERLDPTFSAMLKAAHG